MSLSHIARSIGESATLKLNALFAELKGRGEPVIHLGGGEPKSKCPQSAIDEATKLLTTGEVRYAPASGLKPLKEAVVRYTEQFYGTIAEPKNVIISGGAKQAIMVCLQAILDPGDEVVFPVPYWVSYPEMVTLCGAKPIPVRAKDGGLRPAISEIESAITKKTKAILINSPNNPSGVMYSEEFIAGVVELCESRDLYLLMDDIYHRLIFDDRKPISCYQFSKVALNDSKLVVINGVSKQYAMTGFRIGWAVGNPDLIKAMGNIQGHQTSGTSPVMQQSVRAALDGDQHCVGELCRSLESNRNLIIGLLGEIDGVKLSRPDGTFYCFADFSAFDTDSTALSSFLLKKALVVTVPGVEFGMDGYLRISTCGSPEDIREGIRRMRWALDDDGPGSLQVGNKTLLRDWK